MHALSKVGAALAASAALLVPALPAAAAAPADVSAATQPERFMRNGEAQPARFMRNGDAQPARFMRNGDAQPSRFMRNGGWPQAGGCGPGGSSTACSTVANRMNYGVKIVRGDWKFPRYSAVTIDSYAANELTGLSPGQTFGAGQGYHVGGFCLPRGYVASVRTNWRSPVTYWGNTQGLCFKVNRGDTVELSPGNLRG